MEKTKAWIKPTNTSRIKKGKETKTGIRKAIIVKSTSPAKIFPKSRKEKEMILENSEIVSKMPTKKLIGLEILKNFFKSHLM